MNKLMLGDNLEILKKLESESVDLIYLDPPFFSNRNYEVIWGDSGEVRSFQDRFSGGIEHYIAWLKERVQEMHRILKPRGSIFLHCDWHADAYIRVQILDKIFGYSNFKNGISWKRTNSKNNATQKMGCVHDTIFFYTKTNSYTFNILRKEYSKEQLSRYKNEDSNGLYRCENMTAPGKSRQFEWRGVHPGENRSWAYSIDKLEMLYGAGLVEVQKDGRPRKDGLKKYLKDAEGTAVNDVWDDIERIANTSNERIGYPTQKPIKLLQRIIEMSSNVGDVVMDPFVGGGTTIVTADKMGRSWIGIDQSVQAIKVTEYRLNGQQDLFSNPFMVELHKYDYETLRNKDAFEFESWIVQQFGGYSNSKQRGDLGLDGRMPNNTPIQVKRSDNIGRNVIDNFYSAIQRYDKADFERKRQEQKTVGYVIAFSFSRGAKEEVARLKNDENVIIELVMVEQIVEIAKKPTLKVTLQDLGEAKGVREIEFTAKGESTSGIEFYAWDFDYRNEKFVPEILFDKEGKQRHKFKAGIYEIGVKVVDKEGLESLEKIRLKVNGNVTQLVK